MKKRYKFLVFLILSPIVIIGVMSVNQVFTKNKGQSVSRGTRANGSLENGWLIPYSGNNFNYFSYISYFLMENGYVHHKVYQAVVDSYAALEKSQPEKHFTIMECSDKNGGPVWFHKTHRNGTSIDFMSPKIKNGKVYKDLDNWGLFHYVLEFDTEGKLQKKYPYTDFIHPQIGKSVSNYLDPEVEIDFETMAQHILALDDACKKNGIRISKVILMIELKKKLFATPSGKKVLARGIPFATKLPDAVNRMHEDHYHIDFNIN
ncbi:hypothetical protein KMW28_22315 [Flammeovirga yaeyamensis]|uniref:Uncharacterized protein n=1 Tax=Flammeovirga yaeyamensis TaxID=367791 RepID=A0AAX1NCA7_9BACT|nr:hypothetical protein [Flammeovirga yaeyamensis]MBB3696906.1 penicillin-insensitive murein endopeptidase [Flammeovirga yaeyamensis]NMF33570.1 hypothetical protein [Flammeovirga yaeyamensis]QWG05161.1 hypothetical protein KMW28_22315 [Flammeovirga yaeyamensis]